MNEFMCEKLKTTLDRDYKMSPSISTIDGKQTLLFEVNNAELRNHMIKTCTIKKFLRKDRTIDKETGNPITINVYGDVRFIKYAGVAGTNTLMIEFTGDSNLDAQMVSSIDSVLRRFFETHPFTVISG